MNDINASTPTPLLYKIDDVIPMLTVSRSYSDRPLSTLERGYLGAASLQIPEDHK